MPKLSRDSYVPRGGTPLYDAIGGVVGMMRARKRPASVKVALVIVTDGEENSSKEWTQPAVKALLEGVQKDHGWMVIFLAANIDAFKAGAAIGTQSGHTMSYTASNIGEAMSSASRASRSHASGTSDSLLHR